MPSVVTANRLASGAVVYLGPAGVWVEALADADVAPDKAALAALEAIAARSADAREVVTVYPMDVALAAGRAAAISVREKIRAARGPSI